MSETYGPLEALIGTWKGDKGTDIAPDPDGKEENRFRETLVFEPAGEAVNAEEQSLMVLRYHQSVERIDDGAVIHDQTGYWMWDRNTDDIFQSVAIPRAVCVLAKGKAQTAEDGGMTIGVAAAQADIVQSPFMLEKAKTTSFTHTMTLRDGQLHYFETTMVDIYGSAFEHTDTNTLTKV